MSTETLKAQLKRHEGFRQYPYRCTAGKLTIGYGRNLDDNGITVVEAEYMLERDIHKAQVVLNNNFPEFDKLDPIRKDVLVNMVFNLGIGGFKKFKKMLDAIKSGDYDKAAYEMLDSQWAKQVGDRAVELSEQMRTGECHVPF